MDTLIANIRIGPRHRKDMGDLAELAASIQRLGLLQPIVITEDGRLICGERRVKACQSLGWDKIPCEVLEIGNLIEAERDENEVRKDFTASERLEIGKAIEAEIGKRQGKKVDAQLVEHIPQVQPGVKTREIAAKKAGFGNTRTYDQAKSVTEIGQPRLVEAMDRGEVSISAAAVIAKQPKKEQERILALPKKERRAEVRQLRDSRPSPIQARKIAIQTGCLVPANTGVMILPVPKEEEDRLGEAMNRMANFARAVETVVKLGLTPKAFVLEAERWSRHRTMYPVMRRAVEYLKELLEAIDARTAKTVAR